LGGLINDSGFLIKSGMTKRLNPFQEFLLFLLVLFFGDESLLFQFGQFFNLFNDLQDGLVFIIVDFIIFHNYHTLVISTIVPPVVPAIPMPINTKIDIWPVMIDNMMNFMFFMSVGFMALGVRVGQG
jgi:hypothetical protein